MVFALWLSQGSWSNGWTSRTDTWSARCLLQCKSRQINQMTSEHRFNSKKLFFVKPVKGTFVVAISGREVKLVVSHKVTVTDLWNAFLTTVSSLLITYHAGVLYWPLLMCHSKNSNIQLRLSLNFHLSYYANDTNLYVVVWIFHWLFFLSFQLASFSYINLTFTQKSNSSHWPLRDPTEGLGNSLKNFVSHLIPVRTVPECLINVGPRLSQLFDVKREFSSKKPFSK